MTTAIKSPSTPCVWYWMRSPGQWRRADAGTAPAVRRGGRVAFNGTVEAGPPATPPTAKEFQDVGMGDGPGFRV